MNTQPDPFAEWWSAAAQMIECDDKTFVFDLQARKFLPTEDSDKIRVNLDLVNDSNYCQKFDYGEKPKKHSFNSQRTYPLACWLQTLPKNVVTHLIGIWSDGRLTLLPSEAI